MMKKTKEYCLGANRDGGGSGIACDMQHELQWWGFAPKFHSLIFFSWVNSPPHLIFFDECNNYQEHRVGSRKEMYLCATFEPLLCKDGRKLRENDHGKKEKKSAMQMALTRIHIIEWSNTHSRLYHLPLKIKVPCERKILKPGRAWLSHPAMPRFIPPIFYATMKSRM